MLPLLASGKFFSRRMQADAGVVGRSAGLLTAVGFQEVLSGRERGRETRACVRINQQWRSANFRRMACAGCKESPWC